MNYAESVDYLESLMPTQLSPGLERLAAFLRAHDNPQNKYRKIHVAGTNGKGSVVAMVEECLRRSGVRTGRYTGPHLLNWTERIQTDGHEITEEKFAEILDEVKIGSEEFSKDSGDLLPLTWFELITAMAFFHFRDAQVETAVLEVGLGGRWDATNTIETATVSAIVSIGLDHMHILGDTIAAIAAEKAEIIKAGVPVVTACDGEALRVIREIAVKRNAPLLVVQHNAAESTFSVRAGTEKAAETALIEIAKKRFDALGLGEYKFSNGYQELNAFVSATILAVYEQLTGQQCLEQFRDSIENYFWPGRLQYFPESALLLDGAHNQAGAEALRASLDELFPNKEIDFILSFYRSKQFERILATFVRPGDRVWASEASGRRAVIKVDEIAEAAKALSVPVSCHSNLEEALSAALSLAPNKRLRVATGSFASVAAALNFLGYRTVEASRSDSKPLFDPAKA